MPESPVPIAIRSLSIEPLDIPLLSPFGISGGTQAVANNVLVSVDTPFFMAANSFEGGANARGAILSVMYIQAGHGVDLR